VIEGAMRVVDQMMDLVWAGLLGTRSIAGVGVSQQWTQLVWTGRQGLDTSMRAMVARAVGAGDTRLAQHVVFQGATLSVVFLGIITLIGLFFTEPLLRVLRVSDGVIDSSRAIHAHAVCSAGCARTADVQRTRAGRLR
jgi:Na+-driven multidrug efflux pump